MISITLPGLDPTKHKEVNEEIFAQNAVLGLENPFGFADIGRTQKNGHGKLRIAVLGDSFVWGDGPPTIKSGAISLRGRCRKTIPI